jgi:hypothetical protein
MDNWAMDPTAPARVAATSASFFKTNSSTAKADGNTCSSISMHHVVSDTIKLVWLLENDIIAPEKPHLCEK